MTSNKMDLLYRVTSILVAVVSLRFLVTGLDAAFANVPHQLELNRLLFLVHVATGPAALVLAPFQFSQKIRSSKPRLHRWLGRAYVLMVLLAGLSGLVVGFDAMGGVIAQTGFVLLSVLWLWVTAMGVIHARNKQFAQHRAWMIRSAALTFAGVMLRVWLPLQVVAGVPFEVAYLIVAWACWVPNLLVAEFVLLRQARS